MTDELDPGTPNDDPDLLHGGSGEGGPPHGPVDDESTDDLLNGGSGEREGGNEPPIERKDGQVYGG